MKNIFDLRLKFTKKSNLSKTKYYFEMCCPTIVELFNECPNDTVAIFFKKCFAVSHNCLAANIEPFSDFGQSFNASHVTLSYSNIDTGYNEIIDQNLEMNNIIQLNTDNVIKTNKLCINKMTIEVTPHCLTKVESINLYDIAKLVDYEPESGIKIKTLKMEDINENGELINESNSIIKYIVNEENKDLFNQITNIPTNVILEILDGVQVTVPETLLVDGVLCNNGTINNNTGSTIINNGVIENNNNGIIENCEGIIDTTNGVINNTGDGTINNKTSNCSRNFTC